MILVLALVTFAVATLMRFVPGDPAALALGQTATATAKDRAIFRHTYHLDDPLPVQCAHWWQDVLHGNLGRSVVHRTTVTVELKHRLPSTLELLILAVIFTAVLGIPVGVLSAVKQNRHWDYAGRRFSIGRQSVPGVALSMVVLGFNLLGDSLRDILDPRMRGR